MRWCRSFLVVIAWISLLPRLAASQPVLPTPNYDNTTWAFVYGEGLGAETFDASASEVTSRAQSGPYARAGFAEYFVLDMPWAGSPATAPLTAPSEDVLRPLLERTRNRGLAFHISAMSGLARNVGVYRDAKREDRRNAQWLATGAIVPPSYGGSAEDQLVDAYATPSRYARKLRRHLEAKTRAFAKRFLALRKDFPNTLVSGSGDAEAELNSEAGDANVPYDQQLLADYSPFAILEFRDWLLHTGLYADGGPYAGEGYEKKPGDQWEQGPNALTFDNVAKFDNQFWTTFGSWDLRYFHWSLNDPIDGDGRAIGAQRTSTPGWSGLPTGGPDFIYGGFDAPRHRTQYNPTYWDLWLQFRSTMLANHARDFARWMTTTQGADGEKLETDRWYSHQIPGDYLNGTRPGVGEHERRLILSGSPFWTSLVGDDVGSPGVTILDRFEQGALGRAIYRRTSQYLLPDIAALNLPNWGIPEYSPSWHINVGPETSSAVILAQYVRAQEAGAHMLAFTPWPHFVKTANGKAFGDFVARNRFQPRGAGAVAYLPPAPQGATGSGDGKNGSMSWSPQVFPGVVDFAWRDWPSFRGFEVWRGTHPDFTASDGRLVRRVSDFASGAITLANGYPYYKVVALNAQNRRGAMSNAVLLGPGGSPVGTPGPGPSPTPAPPPSGGPSAKPIRPCKLLDSRYGSDDPLASGEHRRLRVAGECDVPAEARSVLALLLVHASTEAGALLVEPGDATGPLTLELTPRRAVSRKLFFTLDGDGSISLENQTPGQALDVMFVLYGYSL